MWPCCFSCSGASDRETIGSAHTPLGAEVLCFNKGHADPFCLCPDGDSDTETDSLSLSRTVKCDTAPHREVIGIIPALYVSL